MTEVTWGFCWHTNFVPWGCLPLTCGYIYLLNHEKMCIKSEVEEILFKHATNDHIDKAFLLTSKSWHHWVVCPCPRAINFFSSITADFNIFSTLSWAIWLLHFLHLSLRSSLIFPSRFVCFLWVVTIISCCDDDCLFIMFIIYLAEAVPQFFSSVKLMFCLLEFTRLFWRR